VVSPIWKKGQRNQQVYLPAGSYWRDAWNPEKIYRGGQSIGVEADVHQLPLFIRVGAKIQLGDLNREWEEAKAIAAKRPDLKALDAELKTWWNQRSGRE
jgi:alpha-D-xyloside xylohydrolase